MKQKNAGDRKPPAFIHKEKSLLLEKYPEIKALLIDMDGVLWHDTEPIGNLPEIFKKINSYGYKYLFLTNNATKTFEDYQKKFKGFGLSLIKDQLLTSSMATAAYLRHKFPLGGNVYVVGSDALKSTLAENGFFHVEDVQAPKAVAVIAGLDFDMTYEKIKSAALLIRKGVPFIGTNYDVTYPTPNGLYPGAGTIVRAVEAAAEKDAIIIGKPKPAMFKMAIEKLLTSPRETLVIGDRIDTDIAGAQGFGCPSALVLSGVSSLEQAKKWSPSPDIIVNSLDDLMS